MAELKVNLEKRKHDLVIIFVDFLDLLFEVSVTKDERSYGQASLKLSVIKALHL